MKISLLFLSKSSEEFIQEGISYYSRKISYFANLQLICIPYKSNNNLSIQQLQQLEFSEIEKRLDSGDNIFLLDKVGPQYSSEEFAQLLQRMISQSNKNISFAIGGPPEAISRYKTISLSKMTFSHQIIRLIFLEQLYRAFTIINNHPYHH